MDLLHFCSIKRILQDIHSIPSGPGQSGVWSKNSADRKSLLLRELWQQQAVELSRDLDHL